MAWPRPPPPAALAGRGLCCAAACSQFWFPKHVPSKQIHTPSVMGILSGRCHHSRGSATSPSGPRWRGEARGQGQGARADVLPTGQGEWGPRFFFAAAAVGAGATDVPPRSSRPQPHRPLSGSPQPWPQVLAGRPTCAGRGAGGAHAWGGAHARGGARVRTGCIAARRAGAAVPAAVGRGAAMGRGPAAAPGAG